MELSKIFTAQWHDKYFRSWLISEHFYIIKKMCVCVCVCVCNDISYTW